MKRLTRIALLCLLALPAWGANTPPPGVSGNLINNTSGQYGIVNSATNQAALDSLFVNGIANNPPVNPKCNGGGDEAAMYNAQVLANTFHAAVQMMNGCVLDNQWQLPYGSYTAIFNWSNGPTDLYTASQQETPTQMYIYNPGINANAPGLTAINTNGQEAFSVVNGNIFGNGSNQLPATMFASGANGIGTPQGQALNFINTNLGGMDTIIGCAMDKNLSCIQLGGVKAGSVTAGGSGYPDGPYYYVPFTGGTGTGAQAGIVTVTGGVVTSVSLIPQYTTPVPGGAYVVGDVLSATTSSLGGSGTGFQYTVSAVYPSSYDSPSHNPDPNILLTAIGDQFTNGDCYICGNNTDTKVFNTTFSDGQSAFYPQYGGGGQQFSDDRSEYQNAAFILGGPGNSQGALGYYNNLLFTAEYGYSFWLAGGSGYLLSGDFHSYQNYGCSPSPCVSSPIRMGGSGNLGVFQPGNGTTTTYVEAVGQMGMLNNGTPAVIEMNGTSDDYLHFEGVTNLLHPIVFNTEHPVHFTYDWVGPGGFYATSGRPFGIGTDTPSANMALDLTGTANASKPLGIPQGSTATRPGSAVAAMVRFNTDTAAPEFYNGSKWLGIAATTPLPGYFYGLSLSNDATTPNTVFDINAGVATDDSNVVSMVYAGGTKTTGAFTAGSGNGCLDTGSVASSTQYNEFEVSNATGTSVDIVCSTSLVAPLLPVGYGQKQYIGSFFTDGSSHIKTFKQTGNTVYWGGSAVNDIAAASLTTSSSLETLSVPVGPKVVPLIRATCAGTGVSCLLTSPDEPDVAPGTTVSFTTDSFSQLDVTTSGIINSDVPYLTTNNAAQIRARASGSATLSVATRGWQYNRSQGPSLMVVTTGTTLTLPANWNPAQNAVVAIGEGGNGGTGGFGNGGGGGGAFAEIFNLSDAAGTSESITLGSGGTGTDTQFKNSGTLLAKHGTNASGQTGGTGGTSGSSVGTVKFTGGAGAASSNLFGGGGGGAAGPSGVGAAGAYSGLSPTTGGGGGGANGGSAGSVGTGGAGPGGAGPGSGGDGGAYLNPGSPGLVYPIWSGFGPGGGGGGDDEYGTGNGGAGATCGGAGGGLGYQSSGSVGPGGSGCIVLIWWPG